MAETCGRSLIRRTFPERSVKFLLILIWIVPHGNGDISSKDVEIIFTQSDKGDESGFSWQVKLPNNDTVLDFCDSGFQLSVFRVACRELGFDFATTHNYDPVRSDGCFPYTFECTGIERSLQECQLLRNMDSAARDRALKLYFECVYLPTPNIDRNYTSPFSWLGPLGLIFGFVLSITFCLWRFRTRQVNIERARRQAPTNFQEVRPENDLPPSYDQVLKNPDLYPSPLAAENEAFELEIGPPVYNSETMDVTFTIEASHHEPAGPPNNSEASGARYEEARGDDNAEARGDDNEEARGDDNEEARGDDNEEARGDDNEEARGGSNKEARGDSNEEAGGDSNEESRGDGNEEARGDSNEEAGGDSNEERGDSNDEARGDSNEEARGDSKKADMGDSNEEVRRGIINEAWVCDCSEEARSDLYEEAMGDSTEKATDVSDEEAMGLSS